MKSAYAVTNIPESDGAAFMPDYLRTLPTNNYVAFSPDVSLTPDPLTLGLLSRYAGKRIRQIIPFTPKYLILQELCIAVVSQMQIRDEEEYYNTVTTLYRKLEEESLSTLESKLLTRRGEMNDLVTKLWDNLTQNSEIDSLIPDDATYNSQEIIELFNSIKNHKDDPRLTKEEAFKHLALNIIYKNYAVPEIYNAVKEFLSKEHLAGSLTPLTINKEPEVDIFIGGQGSGKTTLSLKHCQNPLDIAKPNCDVLRRIFLPECHPDHQKKFTRFTNDVAEPIFEMMRMRLEKMSKEGIAPNMLIDRVSVPLDFIKDMALRYQGHMKIFFVHTPLDVAVMRASERAQKTGRHINIVSQIREHCKASLSFPNVIGAASGTDAKIEIVDNSSDRPTIIASVDSKKRIVTVYNELEFNNFLAKASISVPKIADSGEIIVNQQDLMPAPDLANIAISDAMRKINDAGFKVVLPNLLAKETKNTELQISGAAKN